MTTRSSPLTLPEFIEKAYDRRWVGALLESRFLRSAQKLAAIVPVHAHISKDERVLVGYRVEIADGRPGSPSVLPVYLHYASGKSVPERATYRDAGDPPTGTIVPELKRRFYRVNENCFLAAFPLDPTLKPLGRLLKPGAALSEFNTRLRSGGAPATNLELGLLGYRPEKRAVFRARTVDASGESKFHLLKLYRKNEARRVYRMSRALGEGGVRGLQPISWPTGISGTYSLLRFPFYEGHSLHSLIERVVVTRAQMEKSGALLRGLHEALSGLTGQEQERVARVLRTFRTEDERSILHRWRRILKRGRHPLHGQIARFISTVEDHAPSTSGASTLVHRDFYPKQLLIPSHGDQPVLIDVDTLAWGPPAVDLGNFVAHLDLFAITGIAREEIRRMKKEFLRGYGTDAVPERDVLFYECTTLVRLLCLAIISPEATRLVDPLVARCRKRLKVLNS